MMGILYHEAFCTQIDVARRALPADAADLFDGAISSSASNPWMLYSHSAVVHNLLSNTKNVVFNLYVS